MAEHIVDLLEVVEIDEQNRDLRMQLLAMGGGLGHAVHQQQAVRQSGQVVMEGLAQDIGLHLLALGDVARHDDQLRDRARWTRDHVHIRLEVVFGAPEHAVLQAHGPGVGGRACKRGLDPRAVIGVHDIDIPRAWLDRVAEFLLATRARVLPQAGAVEQGDVIARMFGDQAVGVGGLDEAFGLRGQGLVRAPGLAQADGAFEFRYERLAAGLSIHVRLAAQHAGLRLLDKDLHFRLERFRRHWHEQVIGCAQFVALCTVDIRRPMRGEENDRDVARARPRADQAGRLEAVEAGHLDVHEDQAEILLQEPQQGLLPRGGSDDGGIEVAEHGAQREQCSRIVIDDQDGDFVLERHVRART